MNSNSAILLDNYDISSHSYTENKLKPVQFLSSQTYQEKQRQKTVETEIQTDPEFHRQKKRKLNSHQQADGADLVILLQNAIDEIKSQWKSVEVSTLEKLEGVNVLEWYDLILSMRKFQPVSDELIEISDLPRSGTSATIEEIVLFDHVIHNSLPHDVILHCFETSFIIPKITKFLMSDFSNIGPLISDQPSGYHIILMDPPWENISASRASKYNTLPNYELFKIPIPKLANASGCLIAVWVTNKPKYYKFVTEKLFPKWKAAHVASWYWLKITSNGELVTPLDDTHRKPYEQLLVGFVPPTNEPSQVHQHDRKVIASVVSSHSRKPLIHELLHSFYQTLVENKTTDMKCLEMFARNLVPHWTSWGNQVLHFQHSDFFVLSNDTKPTNQNDQV